MRYWFHWHNLRYEASKKWERLLIKFVWLLPRSVVMWAYIRVACHATQGKWRNTIVPDITMMDALKRWEAPNE